MSSFTTPLIVELIGDNRWRLAQGFDYEIGEEGSGKVIHCPKGMETDFASIPRIFWNILSPYGTYGKAAIVHDWLYQVQGRWSMYPELSRKQCDQIFLEAMGVLGVGWFTRRLIYSMVRTFGSWAWKSHGKN